MHFAQIMCRLSVDFICAAKAKLCGGRMLVYAEGMYMHMASQPCMLWMQARL